MIEKAKDRIEKMYASLGIKYHIKTAYKNIFNNGTQDSKTVIRDLCDRFGLYESGLSTDPIEMARNCAYKEVLLHILTMSSAISEDTLLEVERYTNRS